MQHIVSEFREEFTCRNKRKTFSFFLEKKWGGKISRLYPNQKKIQIPNHPQRFSPKRKTFPCKLSAASAWCMHALQSPSTSRKGNRAMALQVDFFFFEGCPAGRSWNPASQEAVRHPLLDRYQDRSGGDTDSKNTRTTERSDEPMRAYGR